MRCGSTLSCERRCTAVAKFDIDTHADLEEMRAHPDLDLMVVTTPCALHRDHPLRAQERTGVAGVQSHRAWALAEHDAIIAAALRSRSGEIVRFLVIVPSKY